MDPSPAQSLLQELDQRQDEVLAQLEDLEERLVRLLAEYSGVRPAVIALPSREAIRHQDAA